MDVSTFADVVIEDFKITEYLLNINHPEGSVKADYFIQHGFDSEKPEVLKQFLVDHLEQCSLVDVVETLFGTKYIVTGKMKAPDGYEFMLRAIWMKPAKENILKFVTAYPVQL
ncbi:MAG: hypothetical protein H0W62_13555 [Chitinophagales bacterium]|nr:hypothetical protein [Chitinophagales bacterium]